MTREQLVAKLTELGEDVSYSEAMSDDELKQLLADTIADEAEAFDGIEVPGDIAAMTREAVVAELVTLGEDETTLGDLSDDDLKRLLTELKMPAANSETTAEEAKKKEEADKAAANSAKAHSQKSGKQTGSKYPSKHPANRPSLKVFSEQEVDEIVEKKVNAAIAGVSSNVKELQASARRELAFQRRREIRRRESQIDAFCERGIKERKIMPYELDENRKDAKGKVIPSLKSILRQASSQVVAFSEGGKQMRTTLASQIMRFVNSRKPVAFSEIIPGDGGNGGGSTMSVERRRELLSYTGVGQQILAKETAATSKN